MYWVFQASVRVRAFYAGTQVAAQWRNATISEVRGLRRNAIYVVIYDYYLGGDNNETLRNAQLPSNNKSKQWRRWVQHFFRGKIAAVGQTMRAVPD